MRSLIARSLMAALTIGTMAVSQVANAQTDSGTSTPVPVYGNLNFSANGDVLPLAGVIPTSSGTKSHTAVAQGFTTGADEYDLVSVDVGLYLRLTHPTFTVSLYSSTKDANNLNIPDQLIKDFDVVPTTGPLAEGEVADAYNFAFPVGNDGKRPTVRLQPNTTYWVVVSYTPQESGQPTFYWLISEDAKTVPPVAQTESGFVYAGTMGKHDFGGVWEDHGPTTTVPNASLRIGVYAIPVPIIVNPGGGGGSVQEPPVLDCYALSKGYFKNKFPQGWPASVIAQNGALIGTRLYSIDELRIMLATNSTGGNQIGQLASQLVAVHLSRELAKQTAGAAYDLWNGWAPDSDAAKAAYEQAAQLVGAAAEFDAQGKLTKTAGRNTLRNVSPLINALDAGYIQRFHCD